MFEIQVSDFFSAAHRLRNYQGKYEKLYGHNWKVDVVVRGEMDKETGMVIDFGILKKMLKEVLSDLDHAFLNDIEYFSKENPSSENIAVYIFKRLQDLLKNTTVKVQKVTVWESERQCATYFE